MIEKWVNINLIKDNLLKFTNDWTNLNDDQTKKICTNALRKEIFYSIDYINSLAKIQAIHDLIDLFEINDDNWKNVKKAFKEVKELVIKRINLDQNNYKNNPNYTEEHREIFDKLTIANKKLERLYKESKEYTNQK